MNGEALGLLVACGANDALELDFFFRRSETREGPATPVEKNAEAVVGPLLPNETPAAGTFAVHELPAVVVLVPVEADPDELIDSLLLCLPQVPVNVLRFL